MLMSIPGLMDEIRARFAHVDICPFEGPRVFFENAGGALTLKSVAETSAAYAGYPDNQGRDNPASRAMMAAIAKGKADMRTFFNAPSGQVFVGESGTEVLFRLVRTAALGAKSGGIMLGSTLEHPASRSSMTRWAEVTGRPHVLVPHDDTTGTVSVDAYRKHITPDVRVATIIQTSPVTGISVDVMAIAAAIREKSHACFIIVDGIQHASHGHIDLAAYGVDGYAISPYKVFSRHGYGVGWASDRLTALPKETVIGGPPANWELGTRDAGSYATFSDVVDYFVWLGGRITRSSGRRAQIEICRKGHPRPRTEAGPCDDARHGQSSRPRGTDGSHHHCGCRQCGARGRRIAHARSHGVSRTRGLPERPRCSHPRPHGRPLQRQCPPPPRPQILRPCFLQPLQY